MLYMVTITRVDGSVEVLYTSNRSLSAIQLNSGDTAVYVAIPAIPAEPAPIVEPVTRFDRNDVL